ncbi:NAD(P)-dependent dehydrogenase (short-subunit alcohol dehydrogenase family) [Paenibacillus endophyticus]|uniref:NAD(P)-dependent dehydrogenase (Short-subunit alcohol dehydrogenase family) n=1 Tax=Paenibacillus endophyticus TaxID=1294268 RepID=A0A7W5CB14_9BACL|nr:oxidoreductase [Paenibacillus endophyticus]MBB3153884.1 NAD(P)-dependent dehydrogenase (short-subunit alcohol dehydrogenase family) [Paenibacillus endophyticus]
MRTNWTVNQMPTQQGNRVVITGASSGIGYQTARAFASKGAEVIMAIRNVEKGEEAVRQIKLENPGANLKLMMLDLSDLTSVRKFAHEFEQSYDSLHLLINNAGVMTPPYLKTKDGFELQFGSNHLGHFALTGLLLPALNNETTSRVVTLSSTAIKGAKIDFNNLDGSKGYKKVEFYRQSKLANLLFAQELNQRLRENGSNTISLGSHPGRANTNLYSLGSGKPTSLFMKIVVKLIGTQSAEMGALPTLFAATEPSLNGGEYIGPDGKGGNMGFPEIDSSVLKLYESETMGRLWKVSESLTGVSYLS